MKERIILGPECVEEGVTWLIDADPRFAVFLKNTGPLPLRLKPDGFAAVLSAIIGQQISVASANATWARIVDAGFDQPANLNAATDDELRAVGFSRPKVRYAKALVEADVDFAALRELPTAQVILRLIALPGIGLWTAEIYAKFSLGRADVLAAGDLAIQEAAKTRGPRKRNCVQWPSRGRLGVRSPRAHYGSITANPNSAKALHNGLPDLPERHA